MEPTPHTPPGLLVRGPLPSHRLSDYKLVAFDMDSTLITIECIDELADFAGKKSEVAAITEASMRGEITDFRDSLLRRIQVLAGLPASALDAVLRERLRFNAGAQTLLTACRNAGLKSVLVSGGFTFFAQQVSQQLQIDFYRANALEVIDGKLTGRLLMQSWGDVCDGAEKRRTLLDLASLMGIDAAQTIAVGDGSNDLPMMGAAGVSVAFHAKPRVRAQAMVSIEDGGLDRLLEVLRPDPSGAFSA